MDDLTPYLQEIASSIAQPLLKLKHLDRDKNTHKKVHL